MTTREIPVGTVVYKKVLLGTAYKKCTCSHCTTEGVEYFTALPVYGIATLEVTGAGFIPDYPANNKGRVREVKVLSIVSMDSNEEVTVAYSIYKNDFKYEVGQIVVTDYFCTSGIHVFETLEEAEGYNP
jgi:Family of unknown function (DUF5758)